MSELIRIQPLGLIRTPHQDPAQTPIQPCFARGIRGEIQLDPHWAEGLMGVEEFSHLHLIYHLHRAAPGSLVVTPFMSDEPKGVFACRYPARPNALGLSVVKLVAVEGTRLVIEDVDMLDGTPLLDIKPYYPKADLPEGSWGGWTEHVSDDVAERRGRRLDGVSSLVPRGTYLQGTQIPSLPLY
jgi:tRNA (adenine37-N6)-methyltransferase